MKDIVKTIKKSIISFKPIVTFEDGKAVLGEEQHFEIFDRIVSRETAVSEIARQVGGQFVVTHVDNVKQKYRITYKDFIEKAKKVEG